MDEIYTREYVLHQLRERNNWNRWGANDQIGALNLITDEKRSQAAALVRTGQSVSLSRYFPKDPAPNNPRPAQHYMLTTSRGEAAGSAADFYGIQYHGLACTHVDALCHTWDEGGMWNGRDPRAELNFNGSEWGAVDQWKTGIVTRGVLLDVPAYRNEPYVRFEQPVHGDELAAVAAHQGVEVRPGDAIVVYSGREVWDQENPMWGSGEMPDGRPRRPGLHASCLKYIRDTDCAVLAWDMQDYMPNEWDLPWTVHGAIFAYGIAIVDHCDLSALAATCRKEDRYEFMLMISPLVVKGGTGSPANPLALF